MTAKKLKEVEREFSNKERADAERVWMEEAWARWAKLPLFERWTAMYDAAVSISDELLRETKASSAKAAASKPGV